MAVSDDKAQAFAQLAKAAEILQPKDVDEPILAPTVARAVYEWLLELNNSSELAAVGVQPRRMALLYGPPGTGKTTLAHHLAARRGVPLVVVQSERLMSKFMGEAEKNIATFFDWLKPVEGSCVLLLDEFDGLARARGKSGESGVGASHDSISTILLQKIERFTGVGLAATNVATMMDAAMWRRFGLQISVDLPGEEQRFAILRKYALPFDLEDEAIDHLVTATRGCSPALLRQLMEGMKRLLVLAPRLGFDVSRPDAVFGQIAASIAPPPEMEQPPLWADPSATISVLAGIAWPPRRTQ